MKNYLLLLLLLVVPSITYGVVQFTENPEQAILLKKDDYMFFCTMPREVLGPNDTEFKAEPVICTKVKKDTMMECTPLTEEEGNLSCIIKQQIDG